MCSRTTQRHSLALVRAYTVISPRPFLLTFGTYTESNNACVLKKGLARIYSHLDEWLCWLPSNRLQS